MLNFKQFVLQDARSHPELNPKVSINQRFKDYYDRAPDAHPVYIEMYNRGITTIRVN